MDSEGFEIVTSQGPVGDPNINPETGLPWGLKVVSKPPKKNCKKCYGRGYIGWIDGDMSKPYPCVCTIDVVLDEEEPAKEKTQTQPVSDLGPIPVEPNYTVPNTELPKTESP